MEGQKIVLNSLSEAMHKWQNIRQKLAKVHTGFWVGVIALAAVAMIVSFIEEKVGNILGSIDFFIGVLSFACERIEDATDKRVNICRERCDEAIKEGSGEKVRQNLKEVEKIVDRKIFTLFYIEKNHTGSEYNIRRKRRRR